MLARGDGSTRFSLSRFVPVASAPLDAPCTGKPVTRTSEISTAVRIPKKSDKGADHRREHVAHGERRPAPPRDADAPALDAARRPVEQHEHQRQHGQPEVTASDPAAAAARAERAEHHLRGLYGMVDLTVRGGDPPARAERLAAALLDGGARILQLRMKHAEARAMLAAAAPVQALCRSRGALFAINDRLDVALLLGADVVHLGQDDLPLAAARAIAPPGMVIGISTHSEAQAREAFDGGADYIGFGPVFGTRTKENPDPVVGTAQLAAVCAISPVPVVAIGGVDLHNVVEVAAAGARCAAIISAVNGAPDVAAAARQAHSTWVHG